MSRSIKFTTSCLFSPLYSSLCLYFENYPNQRDEVEISYNGNPQMHLGSWTLKNYVCYHSHLYPLRNHLMGYLFSKECNN